MRTIKFRGWDGAVMHSWEDLLEERMPINILSFNSYSAMQYTGLEDIAGTEIYEGDIVEYSEYYIGDSLYPAGTMVIEFGDGRFNTDHADIVNRSIVVVGNLYEK